MKYLVLLQKLLCSAERVKQREQKALTSRSVIAILNDLKGFRLLHIVIYTQPVIIAPLLLMVYDG